MTIFFSLQSFHGLSSPSFCHDLVEDSSIRPRKAISNCFLATLGQDLIDVFLFSLANQDIDFFLLVLNPTFKTAP